jgi:hypothetical protein
MLGGILFLALVTILLFFVRLRRWKQPEIEFRERAGHQPNFDFVADPQRPFLRLSGEEPIKVVYSDIGSLFFISIRDRCVFLHALEVSRRHSVV